MNALESLRWIQAELLLTALAVLILILDLFVQKKQLLGWLSLLGIIGATIISFQTYSAQRLFFGYFLLDSWTQFFTLASFLIVGLTILASFSYEKIPAYQQGELYFILLLLAVLLPVMAAASNLLMVFLAIESVSVTSYMLVGFQKFDKKSSEASLKYLLFGSISSGLMLFGISLLFGATGSIDLSQIGKALIHAPIEMKTIGLLGLVFLLTGIGFKISMVPFHMWAPDVYQGAPTPVAAFLTVAPKTLGFAVLVRVLSSAFGSFHLTWGNQLVWLSILTMTIGNVIAISQSDVKRLLAYSSVAQAGYILAGFATTTPLGTKAVLIYIMAYLFTNLGAFFTVLAIERGMDTNQLEGYQGLSERNPFLALSLTLFLLSLAGIPPMAGFIGKLYLFASAINAQQLTLAIAIALNSAVAAYYYFKVVKVMYLSRPETQRSLVNPIPISLAIALSLIGAFAIGLFPTPFIQIAERTLLHFPRF